MRLDLILRIIYVTRYHGGCGGYRRLPFMPGCLYIAVFPRKNLIAYDSQGKEAASFKVFLHMLDLKQVNEPANAVFLLSLLQV